MHEAANMALFLICHELERKQASIMYQFQSIWDHVNSDLFLTIIRPYLTSILHSPVSVDGAVLE